MQVRTRVKFCGMTSLKDALLAAELGVDAIGFIFDEASPRCIEIDTAAHIANSLPPFLFRVAVVVNESEERIANILKHVPIHILQFHGQEEADFCRSFQKPYIKVIHVGDEPLEHNYENLYPDAIAFLFDTHSSKFAGGTGRIFNWHLIPQNIKKPILLAGGLDPGNVKEAIQLVKPYAVDVVSGIEKTKGIKDLAKMQAFMANVNRWTG